MARKNILIVDSHQALLDVFSRIVKKMEYKATAVTGGIEALACLGQGQYDAVIMEYHLKTMSPADLVGRVREIQPGIPALILTAFLDEPISPWATGENLACLAKPLLKHELKQALRDLLAEE